MGLERGPLSLVNTRKVQVQEVKEKVATPVYKTEITAVGDLPR
jgi:hypothetical protein